MLYHLLQRVDDPVSVYYKPLSVLSVETLVCARVTYFRELSRLCRLGTYHFTVTTISIKLSKTTR